MHPIGEFRYTGIHARYSRRSTTNRPAYDTSKLPLLQNIIKNVREKNPDCAVVIAGMEALPNMGESYVREFREIFPKVAKANNAALIPFLLADVAGRPALNLADGVHPNIAGQKIVAENVWEVLKPVLEKRAGGGN